MKDVVFISKLKAIYVLEMQYSKRTMTDEKDTYSCFGLLKHVVFHLHTCLVGGVSRLPHSFLAGR